MIRVILVGLLVLSVSVADEAVYVFKERLEPERYAKERALLPAERVDPEAVANSHVPTWAVRVYSLSRDTQAFDLGVKPGCFIASVNGNEYWHRKADLVPDAKGERVLEVIYPDRERMMLHVKPGRVGVKLCNDHRPEQYVYASIPRGKWDADMCTAGVALHRGRHALAETALWRAMEAGMPRSDITDCYGALLAQDHGESELSRKMLAGLKSKFIRPDGAIPHFYAAAFRTLGLAHKDFTLLAHGLAECDGLEDELRVETIRPWKQWADAAARPSLLETARARAGENRIGQVKKLPSEWCRFRPYKDLGLRDGRVVSSLQPQYYELRCFGLDEPIKDVIWETSVAFADTGRARPLNLMEFAIIDRQGSSAAARSQPGSLAHRRVISCNFLNDLYWNRQVRLSAGPTAEETYIHHSTPVLLKSGIDAIKGKARSGKRVFKTGHPRTARITLIRLGNEAELLIDGRTVMHVPIDPKVEDVCLLTHVNGYTYTFDDMSLRLIGPAE